MHFTYACVWDKGNYYMHNQDSFALQAVFTGNGPCGMAMVCDGVGSLMYGEYASGFVTKAMTNWFYDRALDMLCSNASKEKIYRSCKRALGEVHRLLKEKGERENYLMGTTFSMLILVSHSFYLFSVGDCSCYQIGRKCREISLRQVNDIGELLGAVGVGEMPELYLKKGRYFGKNRFLLCSDGLDRCLSARSLHALGNTKLTERELEKLLKEILYRGRRKGEKDNCTGILIGRR